MTHRFVVVAKGAMGWGYWLAEGKSYQSAVMSPAALLGACPTVEQARACAWAEVRGRIATERGGADDRRLVL